MFNELWEKFKMAIVPESHAEAVVNEIYGVENLGMSGTSGYENVPIFHSSLSLVPAGIVSASEPLRSGISAVTDTVAKTASAFGSAFTGATTKIFFYVLAAIVVVAIAYGFASRR